MAVSTSVATLPRVPAASGRLRALLASSFTCWDCEPDRLDDAAVVLSELVGNAVRHATGDVMRVRLLRGERTMRMSVEDACPSLPRPREPSWDEESGRGLLLIEALSDAWGWQETDHGKVVWAEVAC
jgi:anti-sigma regulatory factor (Ser/Thr protein kinase)